MTYAGTFEDEHGRTILVQLHIDNLDAEFAYLRTRPDDDRSTWRMLQLRMVPDDS